MKTAISVQDSLFQRAENYAKKTKMSRSQLYSVAVEEYLEKREEENIIAQINAVCEKVDTSLDPAVREYQRRTIKREQW